jgi:hypothetical protein
MTTPAGRLIARVILPDSSEVDAYYDRSIARSNDVPLTLAEILVIKTVDLQGFR